MIFYEDYEIFLLIFNKKFDIIYIENKEKGYVFQ